jgi:CubicO group peptidase (beta-lactamase class C family)
MANFRARWVSISLPVFAVVILTACSGPEPGASPSSDGPATGVLSAEAATTAITASAATAGAGAGLSAPRTGPVDHAAIDEGLRRMFSGGERYERLIKFVVIQVDGEIVADHYAADSGPAVFHNGHSVTKSVMSILIGIAIAEGAVPGVDATLAELLPDRTAGMAPGMAAVTLRQILTMTSGLPPDELFNGKYGPTADWTAVTLSTDLAQPPGTSFTYASSGSHLLSAILVRATGRSVLDYAREKLFDPLGIATRPATDATVDLSLAAYDALPGFAWTVDPTGLHLGFGDLKLTAPDMAKLGQLYLQNGVWAGEQLVPAGWVQESTTGQVDGDGNGYGYQWWVFDAHRHPAFAAFGLAGQLIEVVPDLGLVVAVSSQADPAQFDPDSIADLVSTWIVPAVAG